jgi:septal ring-binding cell division protein DamX
MRFEIGPGGGFVILVGLLGLSAAVFFLGMISGREMAQSELGQNQLATVYPMPPAAPEAAPSPAAEAAAAPAAAAPAVPRPARAAAASAPAPSAHAAVAAAGAVAVAMPKPAAEPAAPRPAVASVSPPHRAAPARAAETGASESAAPAEEASARREEPATASPTEAHRRGYNIVIDAAMDRSGADKMASRLLALGYTPHIVPALINGQTWYKVQVGPYPSEDDARAAQAQLRAAYSARYVNRASAPGAGAPSAGAAGSSAAGAADTGAGGGDAGGADSESAGPSD